MHPRAKHKQFSGEGLIYGNSLYTYCNIPKIMMTKKVIGIDRQ